MALHKLGFIVVQYAWKL